MKTPASISASETNTRNFIARIAIKSNTPKAARNSVLKAMNARPVEKKRYFRSTNLPLTAHCLCVQRHMRPLPAVIVFQAADVIESHDPPPEIIQQRIGVADGVAHLTPGVPQPIEQ